MGCSSCGRARTQMSRTSGSVPRASSMTQSSTIRTVDSQTVKKVQSAVASNPNSAPKRTKV